MDTVLKKLAELASHQADPLPLDANRVMLRIRGLQVDYGVNEPLPLRFVAGGAAAAAAAAAFVATIGVSAWQEIANPTLFPLESLLALNTFLEPML